MTPPEARRAAEPAEFVDAGSLDEALRAMADGGATVVAGATDLWVGADTSGAALGRRVVSIRRLGDLTWVEEVGDRVRIGALVTVTALLEDATVAAHAPGLAAAAARFASPQIRNAATVGGNVANASPAADLVVPLLCLDAEAVLAHWDGARAVTRRMRLADLFVGPGETREEPAELITAVEFAVPAAGVRALFCKSGPRPALEVARVSLGFSARLDAAVLRDVRVALGAVAPTPLRCPRTERVLEGASLAGLDRARALAALDAEIDPIDDHRASAWYRRHLARGYLEQALDDVARN